MGPNMTASRMSLVACARWNEDRARGCFNQLKKVKNHDYRKRIEGDAQRYIRNAVYIRKTHNL